jgi:hypothetical protein
MRCPRLDRLLLAQDNPTSDARAAAHLSVCDACCQRLAELDLLLDRAYPAIKKRIGESRSTELLELAAGRRARRPA